MEDNRKEEQGQPIENNSIMTDINPTMNLNDLNAPIKRLILGVGQNHTPTIINPILI